MAWKALEDYSNLKTDNPCCTCASSLPAATVSKQNTRPCNLADLGPLSLENNAALTEEDWWGVDCLVSLLRGWTLIICVHKSCAFSQIIPGFKVPIVATRWWAAVWAPHGDNNATIHGPFAATDEQFQVWIGCVANSLY